jgi:phosphoserine aminotransferase
MTARVFNFSAGPSMLPVPVLEQVQQELLNYKDNGMSIMEASHRGKAFEEIIYSAEALMKELMGIPENYRVLFLQGGASTQFDMVPMNFMTSGKVADYIVTGSFAEKAYKEAKLIGETHVAGSTKDLKFTRIVQPAEIKYSADPAYVHITSNNTIYGTQWKCFPETGNVPLVADMSSDILSYKFDVSKFALIYAGAQKNLGPAGVTVVIIRQDMLDKVPATLPSMLRYDLHAQNDSMYNTPTTFSVYVLRLVLEWIKAQGLAAVEKRNQDKAAYIYNAIDNSKGFYLGHAEKDSRSLMNITFRLPNEDLEKTFVAEAAKEGMVTLKGHRSVGGIRASIYNAMPAEGCQALAQFMAEFQQKNS